MKDPYDVLGIPRNASAAAIKKAYRQLARTHHPDSAGKDSKSEDRFKQLSTAYGILSDKKKKAGYDRGEIDAQGNPVHRRGGHWPGGGPGPGGGRGKRPGPFDDFFKRRNTRRTTGLKVNGSDVSYSLKVDFMDAARGANKHVSMTNGKRLAVTIPPGTTNGQMLRLKGQGMEGVGGGKNGDAHVEIIVADDPLFRQEGKTIHLELPVSLPEAVLGGGLEVPTIHGTVKVNVPKGSNTGTVLRLKGKGVKGAKGKANGNQLVTLKVVLPKKPDKEFTEFIGKWSENNDYDVRGVGLKPKNLKPKKQDAD